ncbi:putative pyridine nucleotide-disulfide oxidoreductase [Escherichia coli]|uniref:Putative pyridine nucleotide-disulfide oxidoreductase n=1 Tax=Escherichia coli TaxID=562 RepID=A0A376MRN1_ECOLX|nr:putative pyridine nucleotide-disulfide oxidoreductase [Escherichia coli]
MITALYVMSYWVKANVVTDDRKNVPYSVFMTPPLSRVGMTEEQARESGADIQVVTLPVAAIPRARVMNDTRGVLKRLLIIKPNVY